MKKCSFDPNDFAFKDQPSYDDIEDLSPLHLFNQFITDEMIESIVNQTNLYSFQKTALVRY